MVRCTYVRRVLRKNLIYVKGLSVGYKVIGNLEKRGGRVKAHGVTPEQMVESILDTTDPNVITPEHRAALRTVLMPLFKRPEK